MMAIKLESDDKKFYQDKLGISLVSVIVVDEGTDRLYPMAMWLEEYKTAIEHGIGRFGKVSKVFTFDEITDAIVSGKKLVFDWHNKKMELKVSYHKGIKY